ncbi:MAG TPA: hypothetical protein VIR02_12825 [Anaerolineales bacterium]
MDFFTVIVTLFVGLILVLVISSLISRSRNPRDTYRQEDGVHHAGFLGFQGPAETKSDDAGDWGGREMSHDHHGDSGDGGDWGGGDAGGGSDGGAGGGE